jgi:predicted transcriptional regulator of viral defense system
MVFLEFRNRMFDLACFSIDQIYAWQSGFNRNNLYRWVKSGLLIRLKQGFYTFPEYIEKPDMAFFFANRIYKPSYISLHSVLAFYDMIPEAVVQITSVTSLKTASFSNRFGDYSYKSIKPELMFGYELKSIGENKTLSIASPEKAILDLLYLYPQYETIRDMEDLRFDEDFLFEELNINLFDEYLNKFKSKALKARCKKLKAAYGI